jgi:hypothetical protein
MGGTISPPVAVGRCESGQVKLLMGLR